MPGCLAALLATGCPGNGSTSASGGQGEPAYCRTLDPSWADLPPPPPTLDCSERPDVSLDAVCDQQLLQWPHPDPLHWYSLVYACTDGRPDPCPSTASVELQSLLDHCEPCTIAAIEDTICGPDPVRPDACCYWAILDIAGCLTG